MFFFTFFHAFSSSKNPSFFFLLFKDFLRFFHTPNPRKSPSRVGETLIFGKAPLLSFNAFSMKILPQNPRKKPQKTLPKPMQNGTLFSNAEIQCFLPFLGSQKTTKKRRNLINRKKLQNLGPLGDLKFFRVEKWSQNGGKMETKWS